MAIDLSTLFHDISVSNWNHVSIAIKTLLGIGFVAELVDLTTIPRV